METDIIVQPAYGQTVNAIAEYFGTDVDDVLAKIGEAGIEIYNAGELATWAEAAYGIKLTPMYRNELAGYAIVENVPNVDDVTKEIIKYNSNTAIAKNQVTYPIQTAKVTDAQTGTDIIQYTKGATKVSTGQNIVSVLGALNAATAAASVGIALGKTIDSALYNANPDFWDAQGMSELNPSTWNSITTSDDLAGALFNFVFGLDPTTQVTQAYMDERAFAYLAQWLDTQGVFDAVSDESTVAPQTFTDLGLDGKAAQPILSSTDITVLYRDSNRDKWKRLYSPNGDVKLLVAYAQNGFSFVLASPVYGRQIAGSDSSGNSYNWQTTYNYTYNGQTVYWFYGGTWGSDMVISAGGNPVVGNFQDTALLAKLAWITIFGDTQSGGIEGFGNQTGATLPDPSNWTDDTTTLADLQNQYPDLWGESVTLSNYDPDTGQQTTHTYVPVPWPQINTSNLNQPTSSTSTQTSPEIRPDTDPNPSPDTLTDTITGTIAPPADPTPNPPDTGSGTTPAGPMPAGTSSALFAVYNPTQGEVDSFGAWLWSPNFVDQILKMFNDPMQAIIGLHKVFATPIVGGRQNIGVGYLDSGVASDTVSSQYVAVDCGSVSLPEYFGNVFDYDPFTDVQIYLPFVGIHKLDTADVMRSTISVQYEVDVLTGACLATVSVMRDNSGGVLYQYSGNCAVQYPLSAGSYMGIVSTVASVATSALAGFAAGGVGGALAGAGISALHGQGTRVSRSGNLSGNAGAMGIKKPYLIISRPQTKVAQTFPGLQGYPTNYSTRLGDCSGQVVVRAVHVEGIPATEQELKQIENLLMSGVLV